MDSLSDTLRNEAYPAEAGMPLADFECEHGALPQDSKIDCLCWGRPTEQLPKDLLDAASETAQTEAAV